MTDDDTEARLRRALASRAAAVEPKGGDLGTLARRAADARSARTRRLTMLSVAAAIAVVAAVAGAVLLNDDGDDEELATGDTTTTVPPDQPTVIWPFASMSVSYDDPVDAAQSFYESYLGFADGTCAAGDGSGTVECIPCPVNADCDESRATTVSLIETATGWGVTGATGQTTTIDDLRGSVAAGIAASGTVRVADARAVTVTLELRPLGELPAATTGVWSAQLATAAAEWSVVLEPVAATGPVVLVAGDGASASVQVIDDDTPLGPTTTSTSTTVPIDDDGVPGWPGFTSRMFADAQNAAFNFATDVLGFAEPTQDGTTTSADGRDVTFAYHPRPAAGATTNITVHDTGAIRGWVVTGLTSDEGSIDSASLDGTTVSLSGSARAFEATLYIRVLDQEGNVLAESFTMAGATEQLPYEATIEVDPAAGTAFWVMVADADASGEGGYIWAATAPLTP
jgi:hypothetical protein